MAKRDKDIQRAGEPLTPRNGPQGRIVQQAQLSIHSGPLPDPETLARYDQIVEGGAERIFARMEKQSDHRMALEANHQQIDARNSLQGRVCATAVALFGYSIAGAAAFGGHEIAACGIAGSITAGLITAFIYGTRSQRQERKEKSELMAGYPPSDRRAKR